MEYYYDTVHMSECVFENEKQRKIEKVMTHIVVNERGGDKQWQNTGALLNEANIMHKY